MQGKSNQVESLKGFPGRVYIFQSPRGSELCEKAKIIFEVAETLPFKITAIKRWAKGSKMTFGS